MNLTLFATGEFPLHASLLPRFASCPWSAVMVTLVPSDGEGGKAADTGSAVHAAAASWHGQKDLRSAIRDMRARIGEYPMADLAESERQFRHYASDPRNADAELVLCEAKISLTLPPAPEDPTGSPVVIVGRLDQVRRTPAGLVACDIKTGSPRGWDMLQQHRLQLYAYQVGASLLLGEPVTSAAVIRTKDYYEAAGPVFWNGAWSLAQAEAGLRRLTHLVAAVRAGRIHNAPGEACRFCPYGSPDSCEPLLKEMTSVRAAVAAA